MTSPDGTGAASGFDPEKARKDMEDRFREGAQPAGEDFAHLIRQMALQGEFDAFRKSAGEDLKHARSLARQVEELELYRFDTPFLMRTRLGNYVHRPSDREEEKSNAPVPVTKPETRTLIPPSEVFFTAEVVARLRDPAHRPSGRFEAPRRIMLHAVVTCCGKSQASLRLTRSPQRFGPLFHRPVSIGSWLIILGALILAALLAAIFFTDLDPWQILSGAGRAPEDTPTAAQITLGALLAGAAAGLAAGGYLLYRQYRRLTLHWSADKGLVLMCRPFGDAGKEAPDGAQTELRYHVTMLSHED